MTDAAQLQTPREHLDCLVQFVPHAPAPQPAPLDPELLGVPLSAWREELRSGLALRGPLIATGHQAEFFHAGVFAKNLAALELAERLSGQALFVLVDSDVPKQAALAVPHRKAGQPDAPPVLEVAALPIPGCDLRRPFEAQSPAPASAWSAFFERVLALSPVPPDQTVLPAFADGWLGSTPRDAPAVDACAALLAGQEAALRALGCASLPAVRLSALAQTPAFRAFAAHLMLHAEPFASCYNAAQNAYRSRHAVSSPQRPVPPLSSRHGQELPFWLLRDGERRRAAVRAAGADVELLAGELAAARLPASALRDPEFHCAPWPSELAGWQLRPRALALSAWLRLMLADVFIHGIGGAQYDEITDDFVARFWGAPPRPLLCVTATLLLPLGSAVAQAAPPGGMRDLRYNPQRHFAGTPQALRAEKTRLIARSAALRESRAPRAERRAVFDALRAVNEQIVAALGAAFEARVRQSEQDAQAAREAAIAADRGYFYGLLRREDLMALRERLAARLQVTDLTGVSSV